jgi:hypothetical protein
MVSFLLPEKLREVAAEMNMAMPAMHNRCSSSAAEQQQ